MRNNTDSQTESRNSFGNSDGSAMTLRRAKSQGGSLTQEKAKKSRIKLFWKQLSFRNSDGSSAGMNSESECVVVASSGGIGQSTALTELVSGSSPEAQLDLSKKRWFWKWKTRRSTKEQEVNDSKQDEAEKISNPGSWEHKELVSRVGNIKLKAYVFFASFDQRDKVVGGEGACAAIVALIAHWLLMNPGKMPTRLEFDQLITEGSVEWRKLCQDDTHRDFFPNRHFDLESIIKAQLRPLLVLQSCSRIGFFHPERFEHLKDAWSFDHVWEEINEPTIENVPRVYIVLWNEHFFILKLEANANYIIDSLGERLHEGCTQAYILRFDDTTVMYDEGTGVGEGRSVICRGKECCKEYMKRFLAAITLREFKEAEDKGKRVEVSMLYQRLQIDFHLSSPSSTDISTASTSISTSLHTSPDFPCK